MAYFENFVLKPLWQLKMLRIRLIDIHSLSVGICDNGHIIRRFSSALDLKAVHACLCKLINVVEHTHILGVEDISSFFVLKNRIKLIGALFFHKVVSPAARLCALATICVTVYKVLGKQTSA